MLKVYFTKNQFKLMNIAVFKVQKELYKKDKVFIKQRIITKICIECIKNQVYDGWHSLYLNCIIGGIDYLINLDKDGKD